MTETLPIQRCIYEYAEKVCAVLNCTMDDIFADVPNPRRHRLCEARFTVMKACRVLYRMGYCEIGDWLKKDHTTVLSGVRRFDKLVAKDEYFRAIVASNFPELLKH